MGFRKFVRESVFQMARRDLALFLRDHEGEILRVFAEEMQRLDDDFPEESLFIDIKMVPMGEMFLKAALRAISRFLTQEPGARNVRVATDGEAAHSNSSLTAGQ